MAISLDAKLRIICFGFVLRWSRWDRWRVFISGLLKQSAPQLWSMLEDFIMVHNHPSGDPVPSKEDKKFIKDLKKITETGGMVLHDHIIIGDRSYYSFAEYDLIDKLRPSNGP